MPRASTSSPLLLVLVGPTGVGKTELSIRLAQRLSTSILSADSRQIYRELPIGTAAPSLEERAAVPHYFVGTRSIHDPYSAADYEREALETLSGLFAEQPIVLVSGGSMMYVDTLCRGLDAVPSIPEDVRRAVWQRYEAEGLEGIRHDLEQVDPDYLGLVDPANYKRLLHAWEVYLTTGSPFTSYHRREPKQRPFRILRVGLERPRPELYARIDRRVELMLEAGLEAEARAVYLYRGLNALNTVGYKELFAYFDGTIDRAEAIRLIQRNSRHYARKQLSWWQRDPSIHWLDASAPDLLESVLALLEAPITPLG
ncbi:MAG: tRNA (adenosine(37)-N6)-dimethylallyltransferase MiaA [Porphyromonadaceae bacterium]|nr:tRNA (adenosine(37)-N6)-dimethylallyltransferase MiaA [Porphyromonadaceae bacterium]